MSEEEYLSCMRNIAYGDRTALKKIYDEYMKLIYSVIFNTVHNREDAEDIASEFFIKLYRVAGTYKQAEDGKPGEGDGKPQMNEASAHEPGGSGSHKAWLCRMAKNMSIDFLRKKSREMPVDEMPEPQQEITEEEISVNKITIEEAMRLLSDREKEIVDMKLVGGFKFREISEILGIPPGTVSWHYNNAIKKLRRCLDGKQK